MNDVFPKRIQSPSAVKRLPREPNFQVAVSNYEIIPFLIYMEQVIVCFKKLKWNARYEKHFCDTASYIRALPRYEEKLWSCAARFLSNDIGGRKNIDRRTCFKFNYNYFLVKNCFTTGQRRVQPGTVHLYQIGAVQMRLYFAGRQQRQRITRRDRYFPVTEQFLYTKRRLRAYSSYVIPEGTTYVLYAINKSYFSVHILRSDARLPFHCINPLEEDPIQPVARRLIPVPPIEQVQPSCSRPSCSDNRDSPSSSNVVDSPSSTTSSSSNVLMTLESGEKITEKMMMPQMPLQRSVQVASPNVIQWYQHHFQYKRYEKPEEIATDCSSGYDVLNLKLPKFKRSLPSRSASFYMPDPAQPGPSSASFYVPDPASPVQPVSPDPIQPASSAQPFIPDPVSPDPNQPVSPAQTFIADPVSPDPIQPVSPDPIQPASSDQTAPSFTQTAAPPDAMPGPETLPTPEVTMEDIMKAFYTVDEHNVRDFFLNDFDM